MNHYHNKNLIRLKAALCSSNFQLLYKLHTTKQVGNDHHRMLSGWFLWYILSNISQAPLPGQIYWNDAKIMMTVVLGIIASLLLFATVAIIMIIAVFIFLICNQCLQGALSKMFAKNTQQLLDCAQVMQNMFCVCRSKNTKKHLLSLKNIQKVLSPLMIVKVHSP